MACQLLEAPRFVGLDAEEPQLKLGRGPHQLHRPIDCRGIGVFAQQAQDLLPGCRGGQNHRNPDSLPGAHAQPMTQAEDRVNDKTLTVSRFLDGAHRAGKRPSPPDEPGPVGFKPQGFDVIFFKCEAVTDPHRRIALLAGPSVREERLLSGYRFCLDEHLVERGMLAVRVVRRHRKLNVARQIEMAGPK